MFSKKKRDINPQKTIGDLQKEQAELQSGFLKAQKGLESAKESYAKAKVFLCSFNDNYGRVLQMIKEDK